MWSRQLISLSHIYPKPTTLMGNKSPGVSEVVTPAGLASFILPPPWRVWSTRDSGESEWQVCGLGATPSSALFSLYDLDQITYPLLASLSISVKWESYFLLGK